LVTQHNTFNLPDGTRGISALDVINSVLKANPQAFEAAIFQAIADAGYDRGNTSYGTNVSMTNAAVRIDRLKSHGYIK
jgi:hypothetical protein